MTGLLIGVINRELRMSEVADAGLVKANSVKPYPSLTMNVLVIENCELLLYGGSLLSPFFHHRRVPISGLPLL